MKKILFLILLQVFVGCSSVQTLNMKPHSYEKRPRHVIWLQVAGLAEEHISLLKFNVANANYKTYLEQMDCVGKAWSYNFYQMRPDAKTSFLSQVTGSKNVKNSCDDAQHRPAWHYFKNLRYRVSLIENGATKDEELLNLASCETNNQLELKDVRYYRTGLDQDPKLGATFHYQDSPEQVAQFLKEGVYTDRSCQKGQCFSTLSNNVIGLWNFNHRNETRTFTLIRDFAFQKALAKKDLSLAKETLQELEKVIAYFGEMNREDLLVVVSSAASLPLEFPRQGLEWSEFEKSGKNVLYKNTSLISPVFAQGAMAENFCGIFEENEMLKRILYKSEEIE